MKEKGGKGERGMEREEKRGKGRQTMKKTKNDLRMQTRDS